MFDYWRVYGLLAVPTDDRGLPQSTPTMNWSGKWGIPCSYGQFVPKRYDDNWWHAKFINQINSDFCSNRHTVQIFHEACLKFLNKFLFRHPDLGGRTGSWKKWGWYDDSSMFSLNMAIFGFNGNCECNINFWMQHRCLFSADSWYLSCESWQNLPQPLNSSTKHSVHDVSSQVLPKKRPKNWSISLTECLALKIPQETAVILDFISDLSLIWMFPKSQMWNIIGEYGNQLGYQLVGHS